ncbi:hypothetical protein [uncultured Hydrogenophaga sp.]|uniref:hypothetical protein n=1 Tax=uncultured Hydrogenophaga sp. TaxID=199683 RepID=UPI0026601CA2|nr:hypothetical protein [uncultured Hydrogenophaga sp.]
MPAVALSHPWILQLQGSLDALEKALLAGEAMAVESASAQVQSILKNAPRTAEFQAEGSTLGKDLPAAAQRFAQLRQAVLRAQAQSQRAVSSLIPPSVTTPLYDRSGQGSSHTSRGYLSA